MYEHRGPYRFTESGCIDCEINHPIFGWLPFTADENDIEEIGRNTYQDIIANQTVIPYDGE